MVYDSDFDPDAAPLGTPLPNGVQRKAASVGGYWEIGDDEYWLPGDLYDIVQKEDLATPLTRAGDKKFSQWLHEFINANKTRINKVVQTYKSRSWGGGGKMAAYWAKPYNYKGATDDAAKMATVIRAMRTVLSVVDPYHKLSVQFADVSTSSWSDNKVLLPTKPAKEIKNLEECINILSGFAIHEAWHSVYTRPIMLSDQAAFNAYVGEDGWNMWCMNVAEDVREEALGLQKSPGFRTYINMMHEFMWGDDKKPAAKEWVMGDEALDDRAECVWLWLRDPDRADELLTHPSFDGPREWVHDWIKRYVEALNNTTTFAVMKPLIEELKRYLEIPDSPSPATQPKLRIIVLNPCGYTDEDAGLKGTEQDEIAEALEAESEKVADSAYMKMFGMVKEHRVGELFYGDTMPNCVIRKPRMAHPEAYTPSTSSLIEKAKATLSLRKAIPVADTRLMRSGQLDEDELYRIMGGDLRVFKDSTVESIPEAAIYLLVDMSGSMGYYEQKGSAYYAGVMAQLFVEALSTHQNVTVKVLGHTGDTADCPQGGAFYRIWEQGDPVKRLSLLRGQDIELGDNYDGWAIAWAGEMIKQEQVEQRLLIVLSDGQPAGETGYGGEGAMTHVREVTDRLLRQGVDVVQVAVGKGIPREQQEKMFKHFIELRDPNGGDPFATVFQKLTKLLQKFV